jgi:hypothetical protein
LNSLHLYIPFLINCDVTKYQIHCSFLIRESKIELNSSSIEAGKDIISIAALQSQIYLKFAQAAERDAEL